MQSNARRRKSRQKDLWRDVVGRWMRSRDSAHLVSTVNGRPAFGGTPSDQSVRDLIAELKQRGLKVTLYPFLMMDIAADNSLPDPWTGAAFAAGSILGAVASPAIRRRVSLVLPMARPPLRHRSTLSSTAAR